eukprot:GHVT01092204.1.p2 GENE.GHVT01092204.1~~GHVT01092204.1.p2  ORF type:complete len:113 (-),score=9.06 GHVT01092204.1:756-1094(-)
MAWTHFFGLGCSESTCSSSADQMGISDVASHAVTSPLRLPVKNVSECSPCSAMLVTNESWACTETTGSLEFMKFHPHTLPSQSPVHRCTPSPKGSSSSLPQPIWAPSAKLCP